MNSFPASNNPAIICGDTTISYAQLLSRVNTCVKKLNEVGIVCGDRIAIVAPSSPEYIVLLLSLWSIKAIACPLSTRLPEEALKHQLKHIGARRLIKPDDDFLNPQSVPNASEPAAFDFNDDCDEAATIVFTSGSSSKPKAVAHTLANHIINARGANEHVPVELGDRWLLSLPLYHVGGLGILFRTLLSGACIVIPKSQGDIKNALKECAVTHVSLVATQLIRLLKGKNCRLRLGKLKTIVLGGGPVSDSLLKEAIKASVSLYVTYGLTEMTSQVAVSKQLQSEDNFPIAANILKDREVKISDEGEVMVRGKTLFQGYATANDILRPLNREGWFATGDLGILTQDDQLIVSGRKDNMFISGGENIQPEEIENLLCNLDEVDESMVVPVADTEFGFRPVAFIKGRTPIDHKEIQTHLAVHLPKFKIPDQFYTWPKNEGEDLKPKRKHFIELAKQSSAGAFEFRT